MTKLMRRTAPIDMQDHLSRLEAKESDLVEALALAQGVDLAV